MITLIYLQTERVRSVFAQTSEMTLIKKTNESSNGGEVGVDAGFSGFKATGKASRTERTTTEFTLISEQMLSKLLAQIPETSVAVPVKDKNVTVPVKCKNVTVLVKDENDWECVEPGSLLLLKGTFSLEGYGNTREELWESFRANPTKELVRFDLCLRGTVAGRKLEIPFRSEWFTGPNAFPFLCQSESLTLEVLALAFALPDKTSAILQPVAFGQGLVKYAQEAQTNKKLKGHCMKMPLWMQTGMIWLIVTLAVLMIGASFGWLVCYTQAPVSADYLRGYLRASKLAQCESQFMKASIEKMNPVTRNQIREFSQLCKQKEVLPLFDVPG